VLSARFGGRHELDPFQAYRALRLINPSPYMYYCALGDVTVVGSSPEALVKLSQRHAQLRPIAGTRPRARMTRRSTPSARRSCSPIPKRTPSTSCWWIWHAMISDGWPAPARVRVDPYRCIERYSHVMHMVSGVHGELAAARDAFDLFAAAFPAGTLVGAPKVRAMQIIDELEPVSRGLYGGTVGYFGARGDMDQAITIRTLVFQRR
jgi:anthranilate synthase component 1